MGAPGEDSDLCGRERDSRAAGQVRWASGGHGSAQHVEETDFPPLDIYEITEAFVIEIELPGIEPSDLEVTVHAGLLMIEGVKEEVLEHGRVNFLCMERTFGSFRRVVPLPHRTDPSRIKAVYKMGILRIRIPKVDEKRGMKRTIAVTRS